MSLRVLIVEDSELAAEMMSSVLRNAGFDIAAVAPHGQAALDAAAEHVLDLAIVDLELPDMDAARLLPELRRRAPGARIVACSAHESSSDVVNQAREHVDSVIPKADLPRSGAMLHNLCRPLPDSDAE